MDRTLAIIIPAYKASFLSEALASIEKQSDQRFRLYIGDDASTEDIKGVVEQYSNRIPLVYHRFSENLGGVDLVAHWARCVALSEREEWIWLFSDDDIMDSDCVAAIHSASSTCDVLRFNTQGIDGEGRLARWNSPMPPIMSSLQFAYHVFVNRVSSTAPEFLFRRAAYGAMGGFVNFPLAWFSDHATWMWLGRDRGIETIAGPMVHIRQSGENLSTNSVHLADKALSAVDFLAWWMEHRAVFGHSLDDNVHRSLDAGVLRRVLLNVDKYYSICDSKKRKGLRQHMRQYLPAATISDLVESLEMSRHGSLPFYSPERWLYRAGLRRHS
jgi:glycosyltransferase involved in cell wall biosynthesis